MLNNLSTIKTQKENVSLADEVYSSTQNNYNLGLASLTDLLNAETSWLKHRTATTKHCSNDKLAELDLIKSNGNLPITFKLIQAMKKVLIYGVLTIAAIAAIMWKLNCEQKKANAAKDRIR